MKDTSLHRFAFALLIFAEPRRTFSQSPSDPDGVSLAPVQRALFIKSWRQNPSFDKTSLYGETTIKITFALLRGGGGWEQRGKSSKNGFFLFGGKRHDNKILNVRIFLSRNFVVIAQASKNLSLGDADQETQRCPEIHGSESSMENWDAD